MKATTEFEKAIAAYRNGFDFVGFEIDKDYFESQEKRFKTELMQPRLF